jgi:acetoin utilization deacetylase AcuC-like enzyme
VDIVYSERYQVDIGAHVFQMGKYAKVRDGLVARGLVDPAALIEPAPAAWDELALVHTADYLDKTRGGGFRASELALLELPWSPSVAEGFRLMAGGTIAAARLAVGAGAARGRAADGRDAGEPRLAAAVNLGGGFHHAFPSHGEGFCLYNDVAVAIRALQRDGSVRGAAVVDADVHQGNGTAFIFDGDPSVFTFSIHQEHNYPHVKPRGSLDVGLPDGTDDREYLHALERALPAVMASRPDLLVYVAGADPYREDQLGGLCLTYEGLRGRDFLVLSSARDAGVPVVIVLAGGYARRVEDTAAIHLATIEEAVRLGA